VKIEGSIRGSYTLAVCVPGSGDCCIRKDAVVGAPVAGIEAAVRNFEDNKYIL
jgi:hypothetical protein